MTTFISIHALREEGDAFTGSTPGYLRHFYPRPPRGGRQCSVRHQGHRPSFLSTPSARRATLCQISSFFGLNISIHALREEGDPRQERFSFGVGISIHALREEGDFAAWSLGNVKIYFYPRPPRGGRHSPTTPTTKPRNFYPRPPRGGRRSWWTISILPGHFYPRPPRGGRR